MDGLETDLLVNTDSGDKSVYESANSNKRFLEKNLNQQDLRTLLKIAQTDQTARVHTLQQYRTRGGGEEGG